MAQTINNSLLENESLVPKLLGFNNRSLRKRIFTIQILIMSLLLSFMSCNSSDGLNDDDNVQSDVIIQLDNLKVEKKFDNESKTIYYLTYIYHKDVDGNLMKLEHAHANKESGETVVDFSKRMNTPLLAMNATMGLNNLPDNIKQAAGIQIINGEIIQELSSKNYTLGIKDNNELIAYEPKVTAQQILDDGSENALTAFVPLIIDHEPVGDDVLAIVGNNAVKHPRQVIAQFDNLDLLVFSCGGRGFDGEGMTAKEMIRILKEIDVKFAINLDGGGSVTTVINGKRITKQIDANGTKDRPRSNFLYIR